MLDHIEVFNDSIGETNENENVNLQPHTYKNSDNIESGNDKDDSMEDFYDAFASSVFVPWCSIYNEEPICFTFYSEPRGKCRLWLQQWNRRRQQL